jgi:hypothetical protein
VEGFPLVSVYAFDPVRREVVVVWPATVGSLSQAVAPVANTVPSVMRVRCARH